MRIVSIHIAAIQCWIKACSSCYDNVGYSGYSKYFLVENVISQAYILHGPFACFVIAMTSRASLKMNQHKFSLSLQNFYDIFIYIDAVYCLNPLNHRFQPLDVCANQQFIFDIFFNTAKALSHALTKTFYSGFRSSSFNHSLT